MGSSALDRLRTALEIAEQNGWARCMGVGRDDLAEVLGHLERVAEGSRGGAADQSPSAPSLRRSNWVLNMETMQYREAPDRCSCSILYTLDHPTRVSVVCPSCRLKDAAHG